MNSKEMGISIISTAIKVVVLIIAVMLLVNYSKVAYSYGREIFNQQPVTAEGDGQAFNVTIVKGETVSQIADTLKEAGLIRDTTLFRLQEKFSEYSGLEQPGTYVLTTAMTPEEMIQIMCAGAKPGDKPADTDETSEDTPVDNSDNIEDNTSGTSGAEGEDMDAIPSDGETLTEDGTAEVSGEAQGNE